MYACRVRAQLGCGIVVAMACSPPPRPAPIANATTAVALTLTTHGVGPIDASTPMRLSALRAALPGYDVAQLHHGVISVARGGEELLYLVSHGDDGSVDSVHVTSARIAVEGRPWRVGQRFDAAASFDVCECGDDDRPICIKSGTPVALVVRDRCDMVPAQHLGAPIIEIIWAPHDFGD